MNELRAIIVDDEKPARDSLALLLKKHAYIKVIASCPDGRTAISAIKKERPDLVFLDIQMPEVSGFEVLRVIPVDNMPYVIFVTAYDQYAIQAFELNAVDYLLKPFDDDRFHLAVQRAITAFEDRAAREWSLRMKKLLEAAVVPEPPGYLQKLSVKTGSKIRFIAVKEVVWIAAENQYVRIYTADENFLLRQSLNGLEELLSPREFYRTHRSYLVRISAIRQVEPYFKGDFILYLDQGVKVKLSRNRADGLRKILPW